MSNANCHPVMLNDLLSLGVRPGGCLLVHSSYKSLGDSSIEIASVVETLKQALGDNGTLLMPALSYESVNSKATHFDVRTTPSCIGAIPEWFRQQPGVRRSFAPTHSVTAWGRDADSLTSDHQLDDTPVGPHSPFRKLRDVGGQILFLGCGLRPNTSMHGVEELAQPPYLFEPDKIAYTCVDWDGKPHTLSIKRHNFEDAGRDIEQRYDRLIRVLPGDVLRAGKVLAADCYLMEARPMWDAAEIIMREDPLFFVEIEFGTEAQ